MAIGDARPRTRSATPAWLRAVPAPVRAALRIWLATRLALYTAAAIITTLSTRTPAFGVQWPVRILSHFDTGHFLRIATGGYFPTPAPAPNLNPAFLPGYPLAGRAVATGLGFAPHDQVGLLAGLTAVTLASSAACAVLVMALATELDIGQRAARTAVWFTLLGPYAIFLAANYSESLFLSCALGAWLAGCRRAWWLAGLLAAAATFVRVNGLFLDAGLLVMLLQQRARSQVTARELAPLAMPILVMGGYVTWLHTHTGRWDEWFAVQQLGWGRHTVWPTTALTNSLSRIAHSHGAVQFQDVMEIVFAAALVTGVAALARLRRWPEATYVAITATSLLTSHHYLSVPRSTVVCFPLTLLVAEHAARARPPRWVVAVVATGLALMAINSWTLITGRWTG